MSRRREFNDLDRLLMEVMQYLAENPATGPRILMVSPQRLLEASREPTAEDGSDYQGDAQDASEGLSGPLADRLAERLRLRLVKGKGDDAD
jgi:hypothetical protein